MLVLSPSVTLTLPFQFGAGLAGKLAEAAGFEPAQGVNAPTGGLASRCLARLGLRFLFLRWRREGVLKSHGAFLSLLVVFKATALPLGLSRLKWRSERVLKPHGMVLSPLLDGFQPSALPLGLPLLLKNGGEEES